MRFCGSSPLFELLDDLLAYGLFLKPSPLPVPMPLYDF